MKKYSSIHINDSYDKLISKIEPHEFSLHFLDESNFVLAWNLEQRIELDNDKADFEEMDEFLIKNEGNYIFSILSYDLKNSIYSGLSSKNESFTRENKSFFTTYKNVIILNSKDSLYFGSLETNEIEAFFSSVIEKVDEEDMVEELIPIESETSYLEKLKILQNQIQLGNIYEINYCTSFNSQEHNLKINSVFQKIIAKTEAPFGALYKFDSIVLLSGSPERFICKKNNLIYSQPIKGTAKRGLTKDSDNDLIEKLKSSKKDRAENVMIVDLVRNDLSKIAKKNSVEVKVLSELHTFKSVHQLISTVQGSLQNKKTFQDILKAMFPMGSMTGAPKINAMKYSEKTENFKRGFYSGASGLIEPNGNFDFNVIIRSIIHDGNSRISQIGVGGAITILSEPEEEYEECLTKLKAIKESLC
ncbi:MAG: para-aminobenzoate synthetase component 1 [Arenicella sp.]